jgi:hypothetical protein
VTPHDADAETTPLRVDLRRGHATPEELAAVIAVVTESYVQEAASAVAEDEVSSAWAVSARGLRTPLHRGVRWGRYSG